ncbi:hypothetical protein C8R47DRAFT_1084704 [Mycena vitilis]|nr:hypothetical protein C8R47DRAFT_1084704 [Mycena vitilis]
MSRGVRAHDPRRQASPSREPFLIDHFLIFDGYVKGLTAQPGTIPSVIGIGKDGAFAQYMITDAAALVPPDGVPAEVAAIASDAGVTAYNAVQNAAKVKKGDKVLIFGIGGLGHMAVQYAKYFGVNRFPTSIGFPVYACDFKPAQRILQLERQLAQGLKELLIAAAGIFRPQSVAKKTLENLKIESDLIQLQRLKDGEMETLREGKSAAERLLETKKNSKRSRQSLPGSVKWGLRCEQCALEERYLSIRTVESELEEKRRTYDRDLQDLTTQREAGDSKRGGYERTLGDVQGRYAAAFGGEGCVQVPYTTTKGVLSLDPYILRFNNEQRDARNSAKAFNYSTIPVSRSTIERTVIILVYVPLNAVVLFLGKGSLDLPNPNACQVQAQMTQVVELWLPTPLTSDSNQMFAQWCWSTQIFQSMTMGVSWSSIEYSGRWKVLQQPNNQTLEVIVTSDRWEAVEGSAQLTWYDWNGNALNTSTHDFAFPTLNNSLISCTLGLYSILPAGHNATDVWMLLNLTAQVDNKTVTNEQYFTPVSLADVPLVKPLNSSTALGYLPTAST